MERKFVEQWLNNLKNAWWNKDIEKVTSLFTKTTFYQETPFLKPFENQVIENIEFNILAIDDKTVIVNWIFKKDIEEFDGIYEIKFNKDNECIYFKSWEMQK